MSIVTKPRPGIETPADVTASPPPNHVREAQRSAAPPRDSLYLRLAAFAALAFYGATHWAGLIAEPPVMRSLLMVLIATAGGFLLGRLRGRPGWARIPLAAGVVLLIFVLGFMAAGLHLKLMSPAHWDDLFDGLDRGLSGVRTVNWPYDGSETWVRDTIMLGAPLLLGLAASLAFWPARRGGSVLRGAGLVCLLILYGTAVTDHDPGQPILRGLVLLFLMAAWLWLPRMAPREAASGAAIVLAVGICSVPFAVKLDGDQPWWNYREWNWFGSGKVVSFDWRHTYGPLDWPREGTTLLNVKADHPHYWKTETLDTFDGLRWLRLGSRRGFDGTSPDEGELPANQLPQGKTWDYYEWNPRWDETIRVTVRALRSDLVVSAGTTYQVFNAGRTDTAPDGTTFKMDEPLEKGDTYTVRSYAPDPTPAQMRGAPSVYPDALAADTTVFLPARGVSARVDRFSGFGQPGRAPQPVFTGLWGSATPISPQARRELLRSPYGRVYRKARQLTNGKATVYDAVAAVQNDLRRNYRYNERPPIRDYPLAAFLFQDKIGYCQQFSGAMALMLRMVGIPARVATGFTRGSYNRDTGEYRVRDLDAHSWVEVNFNGIGWVAFDPTPPATPAEGQAPNLGDAGGAINGGDDHGRDAPGTAGGGASTAPAADKSGGGPGWPLFALAGLVLLAAAGGLLSLSRARKHMAMSDHERSEALLTELRDALVKVGWRVPEGATLLSLEPRLRRMAGTASARYAAALRANRYDPSAPDPPDLAQRRALRRELGRPRGLRGRLKALIALPPGGPRRPSSL
jgi:transglutaminase-like putative cysteine protease